MDAATVFSKTAGRCAIIAAASLFSGSSGLGARKRKLRP
jgi:hypothetical protein